MLCYLCYYRAANDKLRLDKDIERLTERLASLQKDFDSVNADRVRHLEESRLMEEKMNTAKREGEAAARKHTKEVRAN